MAAPPIINDLVGAFQKDERTYYDSDYSEARARAEYIDPFLGALGWHPGADPQHIEEWRDCIVEKSLEVEDEAHKKRADYTCRIGKTPVLIVEAKAPREIVGEVGKSALQIRSYAYSQSLPIGVLTNFARLAIYDGRIRPQKDDRSHIGRLEIIRFTEYVEKWDFIESLLSPEGIRRGAQREYMERKAAKGLIPVDQAILAEIERWREELAQCIARENPELDAETLGFAVGRIIDRILFLRVCEARGMEQEGQLETARKSPKIYECLLNLFHQADERYNSGLFYFKEERGRAEKPDLLALRLKVENKPLRQIIDGLYLPKNQYQYSVIPVEILGQVYEQFLGKVIRLTPKHQAKIEDKPEVKKAGGVYYTPSYIVNYIVEHTVGSLVKDKTPKEIEKLRILDPACGSGSFLLGAYQYLLDWYLTSYKKDGPERHQKEVCPDIYEGYRLTLRERKRILLAHIFGVDIDTQAVEVTKLSLLLKVLDGETKDTVESELKLRLRALPDLGKNIKWGNSLIGTDFYKDYPDLCDEQRHRINPFDWKKEFLAVFKDGGFDAVIGNPPWVDIKGMDPVLVDYYFSRYDTTQNRMNIYATFMHKGLELMKHQGLLGFITPNSYLTQSSYKLLRQRILSDCSPRHIVRLPDRVFAGVVAESAISIISSGTSDTCSIFIYSPDQTIDHVGSDNTVAARQASPRDWLSSSDTVFNVYYSESQTALVHKIEKGGTTLAAFCDFSLGLTPYDKHKGHSPRQIKNRVFHADHKRDRTFKPLLSGASIARYYVAWKGDEWISYGAWLGAPREKRFFTEPRILVRQIVSGKPGRIYAGFTDEELYNTQIAFNLLMKPSAKVSIMYLLAILNSRLLSFYHRSRFLDSQKTVFQKVLIQDAKRFPVRIIDFKDTADKVRHNKIVKLVERMLKLHKDLQSEWVGPKQEAIEREIKATDEEIDRLVYELYGLTEEEIKIVEGQ
jgi:hypothetical protein